MTIADAQRAADASVVILGHCDRKRSMLSTHFFTTLSYGLTASPRSVSVSWALNISQTAFASDIAFLIDSGVPGGGFFTISMSGTIPTD